MNTQNVLRNKHQKIGQNLPDNLNFKTTLSDVASYSVSTIDSFNHVNNQILKTSDTPLHPNIFRSNITIQAFSSDQNTNLYSEQPKFSSPFAEDTWQSLWFTDCQNQNKFKLNYLQKTTRCVVTTVDPKTGKTRADKQPLTWLKQNRLVPLEEVPAYGGGYKGHFGNYFSLDPNSRETQFVIKLGDSVFAELK